MLVSYHLCALRVTVEKVVPFFKKDTVNLGKSVALFQSQGFLTVSKPPVLQSWHMTELLRQRAELLRYLCSTQCYWT